MHLVFLSSLLGCWKEFDQLPQVNINKIPFEHPLLENTSTFVSILDSALICPDGQSAPIFVVYPESETPLPVAVIFHSNPVSFITEFERSNAQLPDRLGAAWVENKLWETMGLSKNPLDLYEDNQGFLPVALSNGGFVQIYPGNCWGDYWHSDPETHPNLEHIALSDVEDSASDTEAMFGEFTRSGRTMAVQTINAISNPAFAEEFGLDFPQSINSQEQHWIGLGEGGRAILGLLEQESIQSNPPTSIIFDSTPFNLLPYVEDTEAFPLESGTISRVFVGEEGYPISDLSLYSWNRVSYPSRVAVLWSNGDSKMPKDAIEDAINGINVQEYWTEDQNKSGHVFLNRDFELAQRAIQFMNTGSPTLPQTEAPLPEDQEETPEDPQEDTSAE